MTHSSRFVAFCLLFGAIAAPPIAPAQCDPVTWTREQDHADMMRQLGITVLRPGPSGRAPEGAPNAANYDPAKANPYPDLPDALTMRDGRKVATAQMWREQRRPEIVEDFEREVLGRVPDNVPAVRWEVVETAEHELGGVPVVGKQLKGVLDNSACPEIEVAIDMVVVTPKSAKGKVPVLMMFGRPWLPRAGEEPPPARGGPYADPSSQEQLVAAGWGYATLDPRSVQADDGAGLTRGVIGLTNKGRPRKPDDWGALRAWAWGAARGLDYLETDPAVDATKVGIEGVSRYGKAALIAMAFEPRFAVVLVGSSGEGGAKLHRRNFGEAVENLTAVNEYHWMAGNFLKYGAQEASFGSKNAGDLPVDAHELIALCAPRPVFISYGIPERGDALWLDQQGSYMATVAAGPVFRLLGAQDIGEERDYREAQMPAVNVGLLDGELAWRQHDGGHEDRTNMKHFIPWASRVLSVSQQ
ncbi:MAG: acetylxylan esterase [Bryobacterales bacterium]|nr:acetylxylan esterase [Bryobacterales bacterium]